jgi:hypothetical protein
VLWFVPWRYCRACAAHLLNKAFYKTKRVVALPATTRLKNFTDLI